ncbi:MAG: hypothetical protein A3H98_11595 [Bacteroidetes bacterium RIFCSPLOWO2_02_FULL_36_8]|nr:MAG: hypothetical protein A3H98_11595 [Bacteroidetes bacterium RIFCSPLOWO2_02_FULL_36_8]OFY69614.1 MAG: hypothetical protein A3G23_13850 [Bacteroidetes bacterium RIFCSPLOWO2_12_FULL_37_12]
MINSSKLFSIISLKGGLLWLYFIISLPVFSQPYSYIFSKDKYIITAGLGVFNLADDYAMPLQKGTIGPLHVHLDYGVSDFMGIGVSINYLNSFKEDTPYEIYGNANSYYRETNIISWGVLFRTDIHYFITDKFDLFWGFGLGYNRTTEFIKGNFGYHESNYNNSSPFGAELTTGFRFFIAPNFGFFLEGGLSKSLIQSGFALSL